MPNPIVDEGIIFPCPICKDGQIHDYKSIIRFSPDVHEYRCDHCSVVFRKTERKFELSDVPANYSRTAGFYSEARTPDDWQHVSIVSDSELDALESGNADILPHLGVGSSPLTLGPNEQALLVIPAVRYSEERTRRVSSRGSGISVPVGHGVRIYSGSSAAQTESAITPLDVGQFCLTTKRYAFIGSQKTASAPLGKIISVTSYLDGFSLCRAGKQRVEYYTDCPGALFGAIIRRALFELSLRA